MASDLEDYAFGVTVMVSDLSDSVLCVLAFTPTEHLVAAIPKLSVTQNFILESVTLASNLSGGGIKLVSDCAVCPSHLGMPSILWACSMWVFDG